MNPSGSIRADPNPVQVPHEDSHFGETTLSWIVGRRREIEVHVGSPDGPLLSRGAGSGSVKTGRWVRDGMVFYLQDASDGASAAARDPLDSVVVRLQRAGSPTETEMPPPIGRVQFGDLRRLKPISREWGFDRGLPIDRYYVEEFLARHCGEIRGRVLEVGDDAYTGKFGSDQVTSVDILNLNEDSPGTTIVADLANAPQIPSDRFDCIILTQTSTATAVHLRCASGCGDTVSDSETERSTAGDVPRNYSRLRCRLGSVLVLELHPTFREEAFR